MSAYFCCRLREIVDGVRQLDRDGITVLSSFRWTVRHRLGLYETPASRNAALSALLKQALYRGKQLLRVVAVVPLP
jgi:hypothetical protein